MLANYYTEFWRGNFYISAFIRDAHHSITQTSNHKTSRDWKAPNLIESKKIKWCCKRQDSWEGGGYIVVCARDKLRQI